MALYGRYPWNRIPFLRLLLPFCGGVLTAWYLAPPVLYWQLLTAIAAVLLLLYTVLPLKQRFRYSILSGLCSFLLFFSIGGWRCEQQDIRQQPGWFGQHFTDSSGFIAVLEEPPVEKPKSVKTTARIRYLLQQGTTLPVQGQLLLYFKKDSSNEKLRYGTILLFRKIPQLIKNTGNPGGFDFARYALFQGITHQLYLQPGDYQLLPGNDEHPLKKQLLAGTAHITDVLTRYIPGKREAGLAEALLIGYKNDLDPELVQAYANTGVVHIIAISGLHLGLIYGLLLLLLRPLRHHKKLKWLHPLLIIACLWAFSLLAGAQPSVLRSALMFSCLVAGEAVGRKSSVINTLLASAFGLLCFNPYWLWDLGFQLSYAAVLSILLFMKPVYNWLYIKNKILDYAWQMNAVTLSAQVLTLPVSICHFHQFPVSFLITNFFAVPLSSAILLAEILLCCITFSPFLAALTGRLISNAITLMNSFVERVEAIPYAVWKGLQISTTQTICLTLLLIAGAAGLQEKSKPAMRVALFFLLFFLGERTLSFITAGSQQKIIVYSAASFKAIDFISGRNTFFLGDSTLLQNEKSRRFYLDPARTLFRVSERQAGFLYYAPCYRFGGMNILWLDKPVSYPECPPESRQVIDLLILSGNPRLYMSGLANALRIRQVVADATVPVRKSAYWKKDCDSLGIPFFDVREKGAFVMTLN